MPIMAVAAVMVMATSSMNANYCCCSGGVCDVYVVNVNNGCCCGGGDDGYVVNEYQ